VFLDFDGFFWADGFADLASYACGFLEDQGVAFCVVDSFYGEGVLVFGFEGFHGHDVFPHVSAVVWLLEDY